MSGKKRKISYRDLSAPPPAPPASPAAPAAVPAPSAGGATRPRSPRAIAASLNAPAAAAPSAPPTAVAEAPAEAPAESPPSVPEGAAPRDPDGELPAPEPWMPLKARLQARAGIAELLTFRIGPEWFAADLGAVEEAIELNGVQAVPEMPASMLGVGNLRGRMVPVFSPVAMLGVALTASAAALILRLGARRIGLAIDDVDDVLAAEVSAVRPPPVPDDAGVLLGVVRREGELVTIIDAEALVAACLTARDLETA